ncbi:hypothetical protein ACH5BF_03020 [Arcobacter sp. YIC-464]|uniref:hypothetical protein n=1 Tax=Arcobacter sp. YIC-464 TaxID=3376631 RepID=UPI003C1D525E
MKKIVMIALVALALNSLYAQEKSMDDMDKLDVLDKQSKEFFNAITGLEKDYLEEQISNIQQKQKQRVITQVPGSLPNSSGANQVIQSTEDYAKNVFKHENEIARLTTDFTRTKNLKDIRIKSMYSFNGKDFVVLKLDKETENTNKEQSLNIEGRYKEGDDILTHKIVDINTQTKTVKLYKKLDEEFGYYIVLSNYGISVSDLKKEEKKEPPVKKRPVKVEEVSSKKENEIVEIFQKATVVKKSIKNINECLYKVEVSSLNVRNDTFDDAVILRVLKKGDEFTIKSKKGEWAQINTIYKKKSGDVMLVENESNWIILVNKFVSSNNECL